MYVIIKNMSFNTIEENDLEDMLREYFHLEFQKILHQTCNYYIIKYIRLKGKFIFYFLNLNSWIFLTSDIYISRVKMAYITITAH